MINLTKCFQCNSAFNFRSLSTKANCSRHCTIEKTANGDFLNCLFEFKGRLYKVSYHSDHSIRFFDHTLSEIARLENQKDIDYNDDNFFDFIKNVFLFS